MRDHEQLAADPTRPRWRAGRPRGHGDGFACASLLDHGESFTSVELKINCFRSVFSGRVEAHAKVVNAGKAVVYLECDVVFADSGKPIARATTRASSCAASKRGGADGDRHAASDN